MLVDEAQDTSEAQWDILAQLTEDFFSGAGQRLTRRTFFAVGDDKQSIFSFQGAAPKKFFDMHREFKTRVIAGGETICRSAAQSVVPLEPGRARRRRFCLCLEAASSRPACRPEGKTAAA